MASPTEFDVAPTRLLVIRHGESEWNAMRRWQGQADPPLNDEGVRQAREAALKLGSFDAIWSSDLQRACHTAAIIAEALGVGPVQVDPRLRETHVGPWQGLTHDEIEVGWPGFLADRRRPDGFEIDEDVNGRVLEAFHDIAATTPGGEALVVTHAGVIRSVRRALGEVDVQMPNLSGSWFTVGADAVSVGALVNIIGAEPTGMVL